MHHDKACLLWLQYLTVAHMAWAQLVGMRKVLSYLDTDTVLHGLVIVLCQSPALHQY